MNRVPLEVITRHAARQVGEYIANQVEEKRKAGYVAVLVEDFTNSLYYFPCDTHGFPNVHRMNYMTFDSLSLHALTSAEVYTPVTMNVEEISVCPDRPMLTQRMDWQEKPYIFLWSGRIMDRQKIPIEKLNVSELMKLAQAAIINREGLVIDEALKNKVYK